MLQNGLFFFLELLKKYKFSIGLLLLLILIALKPIGYTFSIPIVIGAVSVFILYSLLVFNRLYILVTFFFTVLISFDAYFAYAFSSYINIGFFASIMETNVAEATSMLGGAWLPVLVVFFLFFSLFYLSAREFRANEKVLKYSLITFSVCLVAMCLIFKRGYDREDLQRFFKEYPILVIQNLVYTYTPLFYNNITTGIAYYDDMRRFKDFLKSTNRPLPTGVTFDEKRETPEKVFVIIGESSYREHYSLYGYNEPTTPFLDSLNISSDSILSFYKGMSSSPITRDAVRLIMSFATPHNMNLFFEKKSIIDLAKEAGYETVWISNQGHSSLDDTYIGYLSSSADSTYFHTDSYFASDDLELPPILEKLVIPKKKQFIVLHIVGSHADYKDRYDSLDEDAINSSDKNLVEYDRTIHHTDRFLREVYYIAKQNEEFLIYYTSDHGEIVGVGHGLQEGKAQFEVPLLTMNKSSIAVDSIIHKYLDQDSDGVSNINTAYLLAEIMGFYVSDSIINAAVEDGRYVFNADQSVNLFDNVPDYQK